MKIKGNYIYFNKVPKEWREDSDTREWNSKYYFRIRIEYEEEEVKIEDGCGRMVPLMITDINEFIDALKVAQQEIYNKVILGD